MGLLDFLGSSGSSGNGGLLDYLGSMFGPSQAAAATMPQPPLQWPQMGAPPPWLAQTINSLQNGPSGFTPAPPGFPNMGAMYGQSPVAGGGSQGDAGTRPPAPDGSPGYYGGSPATNPLLRPMGQPPQQTQQAPMPSAPMPPQGMPQAPQSGDMLSRAGNVGSGIGDRLLGAMNGFANGGSPIGAVANAITTLATGQATDPGAIANQRVVQTYNALKDAGLSEPQARAAALNPEVLKILAPELVPKLSVIGKDIAGNEQYGFPNSLRRTVTPATVEGGVPGAGIGFPTDANGSPLQGPELLNHLKRTDPAAAAMVDAIIRGDAGVTGRNLQKYMPIAQLVDPTLSQFNFDTRKKTAMDFAPSGKSAMNVKALETVGGHIEKLMENFDKLGNTWQPEFNSIKNWLAVRSGAGAVNAYETTVNGVANELGSVFRSYGMSDAEVKSWRDRMATANSPQQFHDGMATLLDMLKTRKEALAEQYKGGLSKDAPPELFAKLDSAIARIQQKVGLPEPGAQPAAGGPFSPGVTPVVPKEFQSKTQQELLASAPENSIAKIGGVRMKKQSGQWVPI